MVSLVTYKNEITALNIKVMIGDNTTTTAYIQLWL